MRILSIVLLTFCLSANAQPQSIDLEASSGPSLPIDDVVSDHTMQEKRVLTYQPVREADILWKKRIWREIDTRQKMNLTFRNPKMPLIQILNDAVLSGELPAYSAETDDFSMPLNVDELQKSLHKTDTVMVTNPQTMEDEPQIVTDDFNPEEVTRFRLKEVWFFDARTSTMQVRILGIAPILDEYDDFGNLKYSKVLYWINYPQARKMLATQPVYLPGNDKQVHSWEDLMEMRFFASYITKESNVMDERLEDQYSGVELLQQSEKIRQKIFNYEHDMWMY